MATDLTLEVSGMTCASCENALEQSLTRLDGVMRAKPDHEAGQVTVRFDPARVDVDDISDRITAAGYQPEPDRST